MPAPQERRRHTRSRKHGPRKLQIAYEEGGREHSCEASLYDFSEGGLGMDAPAPLPVGSLIAIHAELEGHVYSMQMDAKARVAYCRATGPGKFRIGVGFVEVAYRRLEPEAAAAAG